MLALCAQIHATFMFRLSTTCFIISVVCLKSGSAKEWKKTFGKRNKANFVCKKYCHFMMTIILFLIPIFSFENEVNHLLLK